MGKESAILKESKMYTIQYADSQYSPLNTSDRMFHTEKEAKDKIAQLPKEQQAKCRILNHDPFLHIGICEVK